MLIQRERPRTPASLPSLTDALQRRQALFGPVDFDDPRPAPRGLRARIEAALRGLVDLLEPASFGEGACS